MTRPAAPRRTRRAPAAGRRHASAAGVTGACRAAVARAHPGRRLTVLLASYLVISLLLGWRLVRVQVVDAAEFRELAARQTQREVELPATRGKLYDRSGEPLAMSLPAATIYAHPKLVAAGPAPAGDIAARLAPLLDRSRKDLTRLLRTDSNFVYLARKLPRVVGKQVTALELPGIGVLGEPTRVYPSGRLASQAIGFVGTDNTGLAGLESQYDDVLAGRPGTLHMERAAAGGLDISAAPRQVTPAMAGTDLVLTLDRAVQAESEQLLVQAVRRYSAKGGSAVVLDVRTREILAMASVPRVDPTSPDSVANLRNRSVTDVFEPGSVNKAITAAAALEEGVVHPAERIRVPDRIRVGTEDFSDSHSHPTQRMSFAEIIAASSNVGTIKVAQRLGERDLHAYLQRFGYGRESGLDFPGESGGLLPDVAEWWDTSLPTIAIGQGVSATLLQVAEVFATLAGGGVWKAPSLVRGTVGADGRLQPRPPGPSRRVVSPRTAATVSRLLVGVVESDLGTGSLAAVPGYRVGGKTGTAQKPREGARGYQAGAYIGSFAGFAPAEDPALVVAVMLDEPSPIWGGVTAAPVFSQLMSFALAARGVPPPA